MFVQQNTLPKDPCSRSGPRHSRGDMQYEMVLLVTCPGTWKAQTFPKWIPHVLTWGVQWVSAKLREENWDVALILWNQTHVLDLQVQISIQRAWGWILLISPNPLELWGAVADSRRALCTSSPLQPRTTEVGFYRTGTTRGENLTLTWQRKGSEMLPFYYIFFKHTIL